MGERILHTQHKQMCMLDCLFLTTSVVLSILCFGHKFLILFQSHSVIASVRSVCGLTNTRYASCSFQLQVLGNDPCDSMGDPKGHRVYPGAILTIELV